MLDKLPEDLERRLPEIRDEWIKIGLSTVPANREQAEKGVDLAYQVAGLQPPEHKIWLQSPYQGAICLAQLIATEPTKKFLKNQMGQSIWMQIQQQLLEIVGTGIKEQTEAEVWGWEFPVLKQIRELETRIGANVREVLENFKDQVWEQVDLKLHHRINRLINIYISENIDFSPDDQSTRQTINQIQEAFTWQLEMSSLSYCYSIKDLIPEIQQMNGLWLIGQNCSWWYSFKNIAVLSEQPSGIIRNSSGDLHCENSPAIEYRDGFSIYAWHGVIIPDTHQWIIKEKYKLTPETIASEPNDELRHIMFEISNNSN